jgi:hypothetical protein
MSDPAEDEITTEDVFGGDADEQPQEQPADELLADAGAGMPPWASALISLAIVLVIFREQIRAYLTGRGAGGSAAASGGSLAGGGKPQPALSAEELNEIRLQRLAGLSAAAARREEETAVEPAVKHAAAATDAPSGSPPPTATAGTKAPTKAPTPAPAPAPSKSAKELVRQRLEQAKPKLSATKAVSAPTPAPAPTTPLGLLARRMGVEVDPGLLPVEKWASDRAAVRDALSLAVADKVAFFCATPAAKLSALAQLQRAVDAEKRRATKQAGANDAVLLELIGDVSDAGSLAKPLASLLKEEECTAALVSNTMATDLSRLPAPLLNAALELLSDQVSERFPAQYTLCGREVTYGDTLAAARR